MLERACGLAASWPSGEAGAVALRVDVSPARLRAPGSSAACPGWAGTTGLPPNHLVLEITESGRVRARARSSGACRPCASSACASPSTTSAPATARWALRWMPIDVLEVDSPSSTTSRAATSARRWPAPSPVWPGRWASPSSPGASAPRAGRSCSTRCRASSARAPLAAPLHPDTFRNLLVARCASSLSAGAPSSGGGGAAIALPLTWWRGHRRMAARPRSGPARTGSLVSGTGHKPNWFAHQRAWAPPASRLRPLSPSPIRTRRARLQAPADDPPTFAAEHGGKCPTTS